MYRETKSQNDRHGHWIVIVLASILLISVAALVAVFVRNEKTMGSIRIEAEKAVLIAQMESTVQVQAKQAGLLAGQLMSEPATSTTGMEGSGAPVPDDPTMTAAAEAFHQAVLSLRQLISISEQTRLDDVVATHTAFGASVVEFEAQLESGGPAMSFYHSDTQSIEVDLRSDLLGLKENTSSRLGSAIDDSRSAQFQRSISVPIILLAGVLAAFSLLKTVGTKRRLKGLESHIKDKNGFIAAVSHELRTPLTAIVGFAELLQESRHDLAAGEQTELIGSIAEQAAK